MELTKPELKQALISERKQLLELVRGITPEELRQPSLCEGWSNENVLGHILGFELNWFDAFLLFFRLRALDDINAKQAKQYAGLSQGQYGKLLKHGLKRTLGMLHIIPTRLLNKKFIPVPNGRLSLGQLMGDLAMDRAIHYLDIAAPLGIASTVTDEAVMKVAIKFILACIDLLNPKIPAKFQGQYILLNLTGLYPISVYWKIGTDELAEQIGSQKPVFTAQSDGSDFLFTVSVRPSLLGTPMDVQGDAELEVIIRDSFNANALWEH